MDKGNAKNGYNLSRQWFDFAFENPEIVRPIHAALYFWIIECSNRQHWKEVIDLHTKDSMRRINVKGHKHYKNALADLAKWGLIKIIAKGRNQYVSDLISLNLLDTLSSKQNKGKVNLLDTLSTQQNAESINPLDTLSSKQKDVKFQAKGRKVLSKRTLSSKQNAANPQPEQENDPSKTFLNVSKRIKTKTPQKKNSAGGNKDDFIGRLIKAFTDAYQLERGIPYVVVSEGKERAAADKLLALYKKKQPATGGGAETLAFMQDYFRACLKINNDWLRNNMSLSIMVSKFNEIELLLTGGATKQNAGVTDQGLTNLLYEQVRTLPTKPEGYDNP